MGSVELDAVGIADSIAAKQIKCRTNREVNASVAHLVHGAKIVD